MTPRDPDFVRRQLLAHFDNPPRLTFTPPGFTRLDYRRPDLERSDESYADFDNDRPPAQRQAALEQLRSIVHDTMERLDYATTSRADWDTYVRFAEDRVELKRGKFLLREGKPRASRKFVNDTREDAQTWFANELLPIVQQDRRGHVYLLGDPGAGKSTLVKYLINTNAERLHASQTVFSRFEFLKFCDRFYSGNLAQVRGDLSVYISFLLLRDLIWTRGYGFDALGRRMRIWPYEALRDIVARSLRQHDLETTPLVDRITRQLDGALGASTIDFTRLKAILPWTRALLVDHLRDGMHIALVIDGLDCVALEDSAFDAERFRLLQRILELRPKLTDLAIPVVDSGEEDNVVASIDVAVPASLVFVIRENTFFLHGDGLRRDVPLVQRHTFRVGNLDPEVALLNVVRRGVALWAAGFGASQAAADAYTQLMLHGIFTAFRFLSRALRTGESPRALLGIFCGNLRNLFSFLERLIAWLVEDAISEKLLNVRPTTDLNEVLTFLTSRDGREVLRRRSYRLIEILLFYRLPWFEPLVKTGSSGMAAAFMAGAPTPELKDNRFYTGFLDNVFNYHLRQHRLGDDLHPLLEKVRIIQLLSGRSLNPEALASVMEQRLGYVSDDLVKTLRILVRAQFVRAQVVENDVLFTATPRGQIVVTHAARSMTYLEHVYHQTLFPAEFLPVRIDAPRDRGVESWTAHSIRNCFIFLAYIRFVEANRAKNKSVPGSLRIYQPTLDQVRRSVIGIIGDPDEPTHDPRAEARQLAIAREALHLVKNTLDHWDYRGYLVEAGKSYSAEPV
jgi:hypothetical protein